MIGYNKGKDNPMFGKFGKNHNRYGTTHTVEAKEKMSKNHIGMTGKKHLKETKEKQSISRVNYWKKLTQKERDRVTKIRLSNCNLKPNKPETVIMKMLNTLIPNAYEYVGNGKVIIGCLNPDFINKTDKKIVEFYGDYWHSKPERIKIDKRRKRVYKESGYKTLVIWEHELKNSKKVLNKILTFERN